jgi:hypothetical protein
MGADFLLQNRELLDWDEGITTQGTWKTAEED